MKNEKEIRDKLATVCRNMKMAEEDLDYSEGDMGFTCHFIRYKLVEEKLLKWILGEEEK